MYNSSLDSRVIEITPVRNGGNTAVHTKKGLVKSAGPDTLEIEGAGSFLPKVLAGRFAHQTLEQGL